MFSTTPKPPVISPGDEVSTHIQVRLAVVKNHPPWDESHGAPL